MGGGVRVTSCRVPSSPQKVAPYASSWCASRPPKTAKISLWDMFHLLLLSFNTQIVRSPCTALFLSSSFSDDDLGKQNIRELVTSSASRISIQGNVEMCRKLLDRNDWLQ